MKTESCLAISQRLCRVATHFACKVADCHKSRMPHARGSSADTDAVQGFRCRYTYRCRYRYFCSLSLALGSREYANEVAGVKHTIISCAFASLMLHCIRLPGERRLKVQFALFASTFCQLSRPNGCQSLYLRKIQSSWPPPKS